MGVLWSLEICLKFGHKLERERENCFYTGREETTMDCNSKECSDYWKG
jgi:hypothetical protein